MTAKNFQNGSVLFYILIAVLLFAALGYAVSMMMRSGSSDSIAREKESLSADEILGYAKTLREAVQILRVSHNCDETNLSFERSPFDGSDAGYVNAAAPSDFSCHVFHPQGGGIGYQTGEGRRDWIFTGGFYVDKVGDTSNEITAVLHVKKSICEGLNNKLDVSNSIITTAVADGATSGNVLPKYKGVFTGTGQVSLVPYVGKLAGCYKSAASTGQDDYTFYQVLLAR